nr:hypothetical protein BaRGS_032844 [Batillaria attramentaria]
MLFSKTYVPECKAVKAVLEDYHMSLEDYEATEIEARQDVNQIENYFQILCLTDSRAVPQLFVDGKYVGGYEKILRMHASGELREILQRAGVPIAR